MSSAINCQPKSTEPKTNEREDQKLLRIVGSDVIQKEEGYQERMKNLSDIRKQRSGDQAKAIEPNECLTDLELWNGE